MFNVLGIEHASLQLIFLTTLRANHHHVIDEERETYGAQLFAPDYTIGERNSCNLNPDILASTSMFLGVCFGIFLLGKFIITNISKHICKNCFCSLINYLIVNQFLIEVILAARSLLKYLGNWLFHKIFPGRLFCANSGLLMYIILNLKVDCV